MDRSKLEHVHGKAGVKVLHPSPAYPGLRYPEPRLTGSARITKS